MMTYIYYIWKIKKCNQKTYPRILNRKKQEIFMIGCLYYRLLFVTFLDLSMAATDKHIISTNTFNFDVIYIPNKILKIQNIISTWCNSHSGTHIGEI